MALAERQALRTRVNPDLAGGLVLGGILTAVAFLAGGGTDLGPNTTAEVLLLVVGAAMAIAVVLVGRGRRWGLASLGLLALLSALTYASLAWSVEPGTSWTEANRTFSYLAAFGGALALARLAPARWRSLLGGIALTACVISAYALLAKAFPETLDRNDPLGRLSVPLGYWNAIGLTSAMGIPVCLWLGASPSSPRWLRAACPPGIALMIAALLLSYSRGGIAVAVVAAAIWFAIVPLRLRGAAVLAAGAAGGAAIAAWALPSHALTADYVALHTRTSAGHTFGLVLLVAVLLTTLAGIVVAVGMERLRPAPATRRRIGAVLIALAALVPLAGIAALAASSRGLTGEISHIWKTVTNPNGGVSDQPGRLVNLSNSRTQYWSEGLKVGEHHLLVGTGALGFAVAHQRYAQELVPVLHAHNYLIETFADLGLVGVLLSLGLLGAWAVATGRTLELRRVSGSRIRLRGPPAAARTDEHGALLTLVVVVVAFGVHQLIDWTWFVPGTAVPALACAGWLAGRGPLKAPPGRRERRRELTRSPGAGVVVTGLVAVLVAAIWVTIQPWRAANADNAAISAMVRGETGQALTDARRAHAADPLALDPLYLLSEIDQARGDGAGARHELGRAVSRAPQDPDTWRALGRFDLERGQRSRALAELVRAFRLDPGSADTSALIGTAQRG